jgi:hypothetical protein
VCNAAAVVGVESAKEDRMRTLLRWQALAAALLVSMTVSCAAWAGLSEAEGPTFHVEWSASDVSPSGVRLQGYVYNDSRYLVTNVRLRILTIDGGGGAVAQTFTWVFGDVPAGGRADFAVPAIPAGTTYDVTVVWFDFWFDRVALSRP